METIKQIVIGVITTIIGLIITNNYWSIAIFFLPDFVKIKMAIKNFKNTEGTSIVSYRLCNKKNTKLMNCHQDYIYFCYDCRFQFNNYKINEIEELYRKKYKIKNTNHFLSL